MRLMMTSIWYRPCLRIAIVIATGIPSSARSADASPMIVVMAASFPAVIKEIVRRDLERDLRAGGEGDPLDLLTELGVTRPISDDEGCGGRHEYERGHDPETGDRPEDVEAQCRDAEGVREPERDASGCGQRDLTGGEDERDERDRGRDRHSDRDRTPARRREAPRREDQEHEREAHHDRHEQPFRGRPDHLRDRPQARVGDPDHGIGGGHADQGQPGTFADQQPADRVADADDDQRSERRVHDGGQGQTEERVGVHRLQVRPRDRGQDDAEDGENDRGDQERDR